MEKKEFKKNINCAYLGSGAAADKIVGVATIAAGGAATLTRQRLTDGPVAAHHILTHIRGQRVGGGRIRDRWGPFAIALFVDGRRRGRLRFGLVRADPEDTALVPGRVGSLL